MKDKLKQIILENDFQYGYEIIKLLDYGQLDYLFKDICGNEIIFLSLLNSFIDYVKDLFYFYKNDTILLIISVSLKSKYNKILFRNKKINNNNLNKYYIEFSKMIIDNFVYKSKKYRNSFYKLYSFYNIDIDNINLDNKDEVIQLLNMYIKICYSLIHEVFMNKFIMEDDFNNNDIPSLIYDRIITTHFNKIKVLDSLELISLDFM